MVDFIWDEKYSVGHTKLDDQHKIIFKLISNLSNNLSRQMNTEDITRSLSEMTEYFWVHLRYEEDYISKSNFPGYDNHVKLHLLFKKKVMELNTAAFAIDSSLREEILIFLKDWWKQHILAEDMKYAKYSKKLNEP
ncbi:MAG: hemerythrin family protein [Candidatus Marinimicrobia bacterium]|nr:hemerythrin family protein [Candidatus Neomarinimicrobiota bacterium]